MLSLVFLQLQAFSVLFLYFSLIFTQTASKKKLETHLEKNKTEDEIFSIDNYIVYKNRLIKKTDLANYISKQESIDYSKFEDIFKFLEKMEHSKDYANLLCCKSLY